MPNQPIICPVENNKDKQDTYRKIMHRYNRAITNEFYFEALLIDYAMLEDRMRAFLYHIGALSNRDDTKICKKVKKSLRFCVTNYTGKENAPLHLKAINGKSEIICSTLDWAATTDGVPDGDSYLKLLKARYEGTLDIGGMLETLNQIKKWCKYRNEVIHGLLNKNDASLQKSLPAKCEEGMRYARYLDNQIKTLKEGNVIRRSLKLATK